MATTTQTQTEPAQALRPEEAGAIVGRSTRTLLAWERRGLLTGRRCGVTGRVTYDRAEVEAIADRLREAAR